MRKIFHSLCPALLLSAMMPLAAHADSYDANNYKPNKSSSIKISETNLPIVFLDTKCGGSQTQVIHKDYRIAVRMKIIDNKNGINYGDTIAHPGQKVDFEGWIAVKYRGNSSFSNSKKKPYGFKTMETSDVDGKKLKTKILGMPKDNDWVLLAPYSDRSMIRDVLMYELARPYFEYTPRARHCELILDGTYYGVYIMTERVRKGKNRLNLDDPGDSGDELTGGYQLEVDRADEDHIYNSKYHTRDANGQEFWYNGNVNFQYKHPEYDEMEPSHHVQRQYIENQIDKMEDALASSNFKDPETGYRKYIDVTSFIDFELSQEVALNVDGYRLSTNIYKRRDSVDPRFKTALWDFNIAFGNADYYSGDQTNFWIYQNGKIDYTDPTKAPFWWSRMMEDPEYVKALKNRWAEYRHNTYRDEHITAVIDSLVNMLDAKGARERNCNAWKIWDENIWPVPNWRTVNTWEKEISNLKSWISKRIEWMDKQLEYDPTGVVLPTAEMNKEIVGYYNLQGLQLPKPQSGIVIVRYKDGTSQKVVVRQ